MSLGRLEEAAPTRARREGGRGSSRKRRAALAACRLDAYFHFQAYMFQVGPVEDGLFVIPEMVDL